MLENMDLELVQMINDFTNDNLNRNLEFKQQFKTAFVNTYVDRLNFSTSMENNKMVLKISHDISPEEFNGFVLMFGGRKLH